MVEAVASDITGILGGKEHQGSNYKVILSLGMERDKTIVIRVSEDF